MTIKPSKNDRVFLATTALEEFWDTTMPMIFLGEWCRRYSRKSYWEPLGGQIMETPWSESKKILQAADYVTPLNSKTIMLKRFVFKSASIIFEPMKPNPPRTKIFFFTSMITSSMLICRKYKDSHIVL